MTLHDELEFDDEGPEGGLTLAQAKGVLWLARLLDAERAKESRKSIASFDDVKSLRRLLRWLRKRIDLFSFEKQQELYELAERSEEKVECGPFAWDFLADLADSRDGPERLAELQQKTSLASRPAPENKLSYLQLSLLLKWRDGKAVPLLCGVPAGLSDNPDRLDDSVACELVQSNAEKLISIVLDTPLDTLHDEHAVTADESAYDALMGAMLLILQGASLTRADTGETVRLDPKMRQQCYHVFRCLQNLWRPPGVSATLEQLRGTLGATEDEGAPEVAQEPESGFDVP